ncbi:MAG: winged helix-turn-helix domain-containing protein [Algibacter sp.]
MILKNDSKFKTRENLAEYLSLSEATLRVWSKLYMKLGLDALFKISSGGANHTKITETLHKVLELKLNDSACPLLGYNDVVNWVKKEFDIDIKYNTLRTYMKRHFGSKLKVPRKSHYRKNDQAIAVFKKPSI